MKFQISSYLIISIGKSIEYLKWAPVNNCPMLIIIVRYFENYYVLKLNRRY